MSLEQTVKISEEEEVKPGLVYDADKLTLIGKFNNELAAYRARRRWTEVFGDHFLLEHQKDYKMLVETTEEEFQLAVSFHSPCGRYAFWRLVNKQTPEAESKLYSGFMLNNRSVRFLLGGVWSASEIAINNQTFKELNLPHLHRRLRRRKTNLLKDLFDKIQGIY